jgi:energy-coupling factor transporter ATP-binding protein EcfA2
VEEINDYYEGRARLTWNVVAAQGIIERDQQAKLFEQLITPSGQTQMMCIVGEPGAGKSSLAWQLARELTRQQGNSILQILDNTDDDIWYHLFDFSAQPFYVLVDDIFRDDGVVRALKALDRDLPLTILATSRTNEYRGHERLPFPVERVDLPEPSPVEKGHILRKLGKEWTQLTTEQRARLEAANQFLVLMMELATGKELTDIIRDTLNMLQQQDEVVYRAYEYLCYTYQYDISMPSSLLERLDDKGRFYCLLDKKASRGLIFADEQRTGHLQVGHSLIAERSARLYGRDPCSVFGEILGAVDTNDWVERRYAAYLLLEMARSVSETCLPDLLERNTGMIEDIQREATINEMAIWRALYKGLGRQKEADRCVDMALGKEPVSSIDCTTLLGVCRERRQEAKALPLFQQWLEHTPDDHHARVAYLRLVEHHAPEQGR